MKQNPEVSVENARLVRGVMNNLCNESLRLCGILLFGNKKKTS